MSQLRHGRAEPAAAIWDWRAPQGSVAERRAPAGRARLRGLLQAALGAAAGTLLVLFVSRTLGAVVLSIAAAIGACALLSPLVLFAAIEAVFRSLGRGIGRVLTWTLLPLIFYAFFAPFGLLLRRGRRDSMKRFFDPQAPSYWKLRPAPAADADPRRRYRP